MARFTEAPNDTLLVVLDVKVAARLLLMQNRVNLVAPPAGCNVVIVGYVCPCHADIVTLPLFDITTSIP
jgi:hypothetical protein